MEDNFVDFNLSSNQIHYYSFQKGHTPKLKKAYDTYHKAKVILKQNSYLHHLKLDQFYVICKCPICEKYHIFPKKKITKEIALGKYIVNKKDETID